MRVVLVCLLFIASPALGADPQPATVKIESPGGQPGRLVPVKITYTGDVCKYKFVPGKYDFFREFTDEPKTFAFRIFAENATKVTLSAVSSGPNGLGELEIVEIPIAANPVPVDPIKPPPVVTPPSDGLYFMVIRPDGPAHPTFTQIMSLDAWSELRAKGHTVKDFTLTDARAKGAVIPPETLLPCVLTLRDDGKKSVVVRKPIPIPSTADAIRWLPEGIK